MVLKPSLALPLAVVALTGCHGKASDGSTNPANVATRAKDSFPAAIEPPPSPEVRWTPDTFSYTVTKPVVISVAALAQSDLDADTNQNLNTIIDDFDTYLKEIEDSLSRLGVAFESANTVIVRLRTDSSWSTWAFPRGSVGYLFAAPGRSPKRLMGVYTAGGLMPELRAYLR